MERIFDSTGISASSPCLITGATGFLGGHLARRLISLGIPVRLTFRDPKKAIPFVGAPHVQLLPGDLRDPEYLRHAVKGASYVFHCAALASDWGSKKSFVEANVHVAKHLAQVALQEGIRRFIHVSSTDVYGYPDKPERATVLKKSGIFYSDSKLEGEKAVLEYLLSGLPGTIVRPATIYGPGSYSIVKEFVSVLRNHQMLYIRGGRTNAGLCYVENVVDLLLLVAQHPRALGQAYDITDGLPITWKDFITSLATIIHCPPPRFSLPFDIAYALGWLMEHGKPTSSKKRPLLTRMAVNLLGKSQDFSIEKARNELGYVPRIDFTEGMNRTAHWIHSDFPSAF